MKIETKLLLKPKDIKPSFSEWKIDGVLNPAAIRLLDKKIMLLARIAESTSTHTEEHLHCPVIISKDEYKISTEKVKKAEIKSRNEKVIYLRNGMCRLTNISHFRKIILSEDGFKVTFISKIPDFTGAPEDGEYGVEDPRISKIGKKYYMTYVSISKKNGISSSLSESMNLVNWARRGIIFREQNKDCVIFPEKIKGRYVALNRPEVFFEFHRPAIWISYSKDLEYWGKETSLMLPRENSWESERIGAGPPPIKTKLGWLLIYHGVKLKNEKNIYNCGAALLDLKNPEKIIARSPKNKPLIIPNKNFEKKGFINNVVFPTGAILDLNGKDLLIYSGGADSVISVRKLGINDIMKSMEYY